MRSLEREIMEKFHQLHPAAKQRVRALIEQETAASTFDYDGWFRDVERLRQEIRASQGDKLSPVDVVGMLRDIRNGGGELPLLSMPTS